MRGSVHSTVGGNNSTYNSKPNSRSHCKDCWRKAPFEHKVQGVIAMTSRSLTVVFVVFLLLVGSAIAYTGYAYTTAFKDGYERGLSDGFNEGHRKALYARPPSDDLELVCAGLWIGEQQKIHDEREAIEIKEQKWR